MSAFCFKGGQIPITDIDFGKNQSSQNTMLFFFFLAFWYTVYHIFLTSDMIILWLILASAMSFAVALSLYSSTSDRFKINETNYFNQIQSILKCAFVVVFFPPLFKTKTMFPKKDKNEQGDWSYTAGEI